MDTAPRLPGFGDGNIGIDRSQLERYVAGLDPRTPAAGPLAPNTPFCTGTGADEIVLRPAPSDPNVTRAFRIGSVEGTRDGTVNVPVEADLAGGEIMTQFTIHFDPSVLSISDIAGTGINPDILLGDSLPEGTRVTINTSEIATGDIGIIVYFNGSGSYPALTAEPGTRTLVTLRFRLEDSVKIGSITPITFNDHVFETKASDTLGQTLIVSGGLRGGAAVVRK